MPDGRELNPVQRQSLMNKLAALQRRPGVAQGDNVPGVPCFSQISHHGDLSYIIAPTPPAGGSKLLQWGDLLLLFTCCDETLTSA